MPTSNDHLTLIEERAKRVSKLRELTKLSRREFAENHHIPAPTIQNWEIGKGFGITEKGALKLVAALNKEGIACTFEWLMYGAGEDPTLKRIGSKTSTANHSLTSQNTKVIAHYADNPEYYQLMISQELHFFQQLHQSILHTVIKDELMEPFYKKGEIVAGLTLGRDDIQLAIGYDCILKTTAGEILVRKIEKENIPDTISLAYYNLADKNLSLSHTLKISAISELAPIVWVRRPLIF